MFVLVSYDVKTSELGGNRRLLRVSKACKDYGQRVQYSVFECIVGPAQWIVLRQRLIEEIDSEKDSLRFYFLGANWRHKLEHIGKVLLEVNQSFDWNVYYTKSSFPEDAIYSGSGQVGQPALVFSINVSKTQLEEQKYFLLNLVGHSHHSGKNGGLYEKLDSITTAKNIADRIIVSFEKK